MYKEIIIPRKRNIQVRIPKRFINQKLEITIKPTEKKISFNKYFGSMKVSNIDKEIKDLRKEWDRNL